MIYRKISILRWLIRFDIINIETIYPFFDILKHHCCIYVRNFNRIINIIRTSEIRFRNSVISLGQVHYLFEENISQIINC